MAPAKPPPPTWAQLKTPTTAEQRITFLDACQRHFEVVRVVGPVSGALLPPSQRPEPASGASTSFFTALDDVPTPTQSSPRCVVCSQPATAALVSNPFSDWAAVLCPLCTPP